MRATIRTDIVGIVSVSVQAATAGVIAALARAVAERWPSCGLDPASVRTNCVVFTHGDPSALIAHLAAEGVLAGTIAPRTMRFMTHVDVNDADVDVVRKALATAP